MQRKVLPSLSASLDAHVYLVVKTECKTVVHTLKYEGLARSIQELLPEVRNVVVPSLEEWLDGSVAHDSFVKSLSEVEHDPVFIVHTSGTTGTANRALDMNAFTEQIWRPKTSCVHAWTSVCDR